MKSAWKEIRLGDVIEFHRGYDLPQTAFISGNIPVAGSNGTIGYHNESTTKGPGITIGRSGNIGTPKFYPTNFWAHNTVLYVNDFKGNDEKFIFYLLHQIDFSKFNSGSAVPSLNRNYIYNISVNLPPLPIQRTIATTLSSLDDKIDLLTRQNATLEALAQTYFRQWFVEEAGEEIELGSLASVSTGKGLKKDKYCDFGKYPVLGANGEIGRTNEFLYDEDVILTGRVGTHGKVFLVNKKAWISDNVLIIKPLQKHYKYALYFLLLSLDYESLNIGSTQPLITQTDLKKQTLFASNKLLLKFQDQVAPYFDKIESNIRQILTLQKLRDTLLPKLISGEVRVKQQEETANG
ncbi:restriction endonuclease subunit S [Breznakiellaceae bacterium SP9]